MESFHLDIIPLRGEARFVGFTARDSWSVSAIDVWGFPQEYGLQMVYGRTDIEPSIDASDQLAKLGYARLPQWSAARRSFGLEYPFLGFGVGSICDRAFGWPTRGMSYSTVITPLHSPTTLVESAGLMRISGRRLSSDSWEGDAYHRLPLRPILPSFIINTLFYAAIWFELFFTFGFAKRAIRRERGRCVKCGHDLRGEFDGGCPECGRGREASCSVGQASRLSIVGPPDRRPSPSRRSIAP